MKHHHKLLLVEDSKEVQLVVLGFLNDLVEVDCAGTLAEARQVLSKDVYSILILDIGLPDGDGFHFCSELRNDRKFDDLEILFLSSRTQVQDKVLAFKTGGDDFITKPFSGPELRGRIESRIRKLDRHTRGGGDEVLLGGLKIRLAQQTAAYNENSKWQDIPLTAHEFRLLKFLVENEGQVFSRDQLLEHVWGPNSHVNDRVVDSHVSRLRKKIAPSGVKIRAHYGSGYTLENTKTSIKSAS